MRLYFNQLQTTLILDRYLKFFFLFRFRESEIYNHFMWNLNDWNVTVLKQER